MKRTLWLVVLAVAIAAGVKGQTMPALSDASEENWYVIRFLKGGGAVTSNGEGEQVTTGVATGKASQLWKIEGSSDEGYTFTTKTGQQLYVEGLSSGSAFMTSESPTENYLFTFVTTTSTTYADNWIIAPMEATSLYLNQWGGSGIDVGLALYTSRSDDGQPVEFVSEEELAEELADLLPLIPYPVSVTKGDGELALSSLTAISCIDDSTGLIADNLASALATVAGLELSVVESTGEAQEGYINMVYAEQEDGDEAYALTIDETGITIEAQAYAGFFYGVQTLKQLMPATIYGEEADEESDWTVPYVEIEDAPNLTHRGFMLDVSRHFFDIDEVKKLLDVASIYKFNRFHWHLTDDQGWRVEIPEWPKLTTVGAIRSKSLTVNDPSNSVTFYDDTEYGRGCYFTLEELAEVVAYAKERAIEIIPEIDLPGHMVAALAAYPELSCNPEATYSVWYTAGISSDVLNVGNDTVIDFLKCVLGHIAEVFPYKYIHLGGDECPTTSWETNDECLARIEEEGLTGVDDLQPWLVELLGQWLKENYGKTPVVWDELLSAWDDDYETEPVIMAWNSASYTATAANKGFSSINVPYSPLYLDQIQVDADDIEVDAPYIGGWGDYLVNSVYSVYSFNPLSYATSDYVLGTQGNLWTESCSSNTEAEYQYFPRLLALSEMAWLPTSLKDYASFYLRLQESVEILDVKDVVYAPYCIEEEELSDGEAALAEAQELLDESEPGAVGYPSQEAYDALAAALAAATTDDYEALEEAIATYKAADIVKPEAGKIYQIVSAATYFRRHYNGSTVYAKGSTLYFHYTPQLEPEELWYITEQADGGYLFTRVANGLQVGLPTLSSGATLSESSGTAVDFSVPTESNGDYDYIPGVVLITNYADSTASSARRFYGETTGQVIAYDDEQLCMPGTWRIIEVTDYTTYLQSLYDKCVLIEETAEPGSYGEPTEEALEWLQTNLIDPASQTLADSLVISEATYLEYVALYQIFADMETTGLLESLDEGYYYYIQNAYFTSYYAYASSEKIKYVKPGTALDTDGYKWCIEKNDDGTVYLWNALTGTGAYVSSIAAEQRIRLSDTPDPWTLTEVTTDQGDSSIAIVSADGYYGWYTNPNAWSYLLLEPYSWGASIWNFIKTSSSATGISEVAVESEGDEGETVYYDLQGRQVQNPGHGVFVTSKHTKILK